MNRILILIVFCSYLFPLEVDSLRARTPANAAKYGAIFPGGGQVYNGRWLKAAFLLSLEAASIYQWSLNGDIYKNYDSGNYSLRKHRYLEKRNKYAWWAVFIYIYGMLDAVVDAHLNPFNSVMTENIETIETKSEEE